MKIEEGFDVIFRRSSLDFERMVRLRNVTRSVALSTRAEDPTLMRGVVWRAGDAYEVELCDYH